MPFCLQFLDAGGNVSGTGTTAHWGFGLIGCLAGYAQFPLLHDTLQASLRRGFFCTEIESAAGLPGMNKQRWQTTPEALNETLPP